MNTSFGGRILYFLRLFFPIQLIFGHLKYNLFALLFWVILFLIVTDQLGSKFGVPFLFYTPEYQAETNPTAFALLGFAIGGFTMAFNMFSYITLSSKYPFLATLSRPFFKFCLNNSIIPASFLITHIVHFSRFQRLEEFASSSEIWMDILAYLVGFSLFVLISLLYFFPTNKDFFKFTGQKADEEDEEPIHSFLHNNKITWNEFFRYEKERSYIYWCTLFRWKKSRSVQHYDRAILKRVFAQNRINASLFELVTILAFFILGMFRELPWLDLPAGMSIVLLLSIILMFFSIFKSWFNYWAYVVLIFAIIGMNYLSKKTDFFRYRNYAYGLSYQKDKLRDYSVAAIYKEGKKQDLVKETQQQYLQRLDAWKKQTGKQKPKLIVLISSGGGSRSAFWTFSVLQKVDQHLEGKLSKHIQMMTGASGGMIGASFFRQLYLEDQLNQTNLRYDPIYRQAISKDLLNKLSVSAFSSDLFVRYQQAQIAGNRYTKDRGYAFEQHLHQNTLNKLNHPLSFYKQFEKNGAIPTMILTPTIANDGRRMIIGTESLAFLCYDIKGKKSPTSSYENIDFQSFFKGNQCDSLRFSSALRMSASFPFVLPMVSLPTQPEMQLMDAGLRDNYGGKIMMEYLYELEDWIEENTSGVIVLQVRDTKKLLNGETYEEISLKDKFTMPFGNMYDNFPKTQDFDQDELMKIGFERFSFPIDLVTFNLREAPKERISLSWHLTTQEKMKIEKAYLSIGNRFALKQLKYLLR